MKRQRANPAIVLLVLAGAGAAHASDNVLPGDDVRVVVTAIMAETRVLSSGLALDRSNGHDEAAAGRPGGSSAYSTDLTLGTQGAMDQLRAALAKPLSLELQGAATQRAAFNAYMADVHRDALEMSSGGLNWLLPGGGAKLVLYAHFARGHAGDPVAHSPAAETWGVSPATDRAQLSLTLQAQIPF